MTELRKQIITDLTTDADVATHTDQNTNIDGASGLVTVAGIYARISDSLVKPVALDAATHALEIIDYNHHEIHAGSHYFIQDVEDLPINNVFDMQWTTPDTTKWSHFTFTLATEGETSWYIYEGATISTAGTAITPRNNNRNVADNSTQVIAGILNTSLANANADTAVGAATELAHGILGAGKTGGAEDRSLEIILKQNTIYCMRAIATAAGFVNFRVEWYEHTNKD